jgi:hypothetical protein
MNGRLLRAIHKVHFTLPKRHWRSRHAGALSKIRCRRGEKQAEGRHESYSTHCPDIFAPISSESACNRLHIKRATVLNRNDLTVTSQSLYKRYMSDIISNDAAHPEWRQLCQAALFEFNPAKLLERIARARNAILDRIEDGHSKSPNSEQSALREALATLDTLRGITERQNGYQSKAS